MKGLRNLLIIIGLVVISGAFALVVIGTPGRNRPALGEGPSAKTNVDSPAPAETNAGSSLPAKTDEENLLEVIVKPLEFNPGRPATFEIALNTHMGSLDYDLASPSVSTLEDDLGNKYSPTSWSGSTGGHHLSGVLTFPELKGKTKMIRLTLKGLYDVPERVFEWTIPN